MSENNVEGQKTNLNELEDTRMTVTQSSTSTITFANPLVAEHMPHCLSDICKTGTGLEYSYVRFVARNRALTDIDILKVYINLRYIDISENRIQDLSPLSHLTYMLSLKANSNLLREGIVEEMPFLQFVDFSKNIFTTVGGVFHPELEILHLKHNKLKTMCTIQSHQLTNLHTLELRGNQFESTGNLNLPSLQKLYLAQNKIERLEGLDSLQQLSILHLRSNRIAVLDGFSRKNACLTYVNLRDNKISVFEEVSKLNCLPALKELVLLENEVNTERESIFLDILMYFPNIQRINKTHVTNADKREAKRKLKRVMEEAEVERQRLEEEERQRQEEEEELRLRSLAEGEESQQRETSFSSTLDKSGGGQERAFEG